MVGGVQATNAFLERRSWMPVEVAAAVVVVSSSGHG
jgi:hypothetical protein